MSTTYVCQVCEQSVVDPDMEPHGQHPRGWFRYIDVLQAPEWTLCCSRECVAIYQASRPEITLEALEAKRIEELRRMSPEEQAAYRAIPGGLRF